MFLESVFHTHLYVYIGMSILVFMFYNSTMKLNVHMHVFNHRCLLCICIIAIVVRRYVGLMYFFQDVFSGSLTCCLCTVYIVKLQIQKITLFVDNFKIL